MKYCAGAATALGLSELFTAESIALALESAAKKPPLIWLEGQDCAGCAISLISVENPSPVSLILDKISIKYRETIMAVSGHMAEKTREETIKEGGYVLVAEGTIPSADDRFCMVGGHSFREIAIEIAENAAAIIGVGACTAFGEIPRSTPQLPTSDPF